MNMNKYLFLKRTFFCLLLLNFVYASAQVNNDQQIAVLKNVVPPSPNSSSLGKYGEWPVSLYTGVPNISVPVTELKGRTISVPVSLSYHASGNKVGETPSWVGLGWSLNAGGAVTRSLRGLPDENGYFTNAANHTNPNDYSSAAINPQADAQALVGSVRNSNDVLQDIYNFNALGKSYKFILKNDGSMLTIPASSVKLIASPVVGPNITASTWTILLEDGTKLLFGGGPTYTEITTNPRFALLDGAGISYTSSWMLQSVTTPSNEVISFTYFTPSVVSQDVYHSQSDFLQYSQIPGNPVTHSSSLKSTVEKQDVTALNLATIESDLCRIEFIPGATARQDFPGTYPLQEIKVYSKRDNKYIEDYILTTNYTSAVSSNVVSTPATVNDTYVNYRLRLNSLEKKDINNPAATGQKWIFDYNPQNLPPRRSVAQDHWGFFNGATSNSSLLPQAYFVIDSVYTTLIGGQSLYGFFPPYHDPGGNREANANYLQAEILTKITYPAGGYSSFTYEPNSIPVSQETFTSTQLPLVLNMYANQNPPSNTVTTTFTITKPQYIHVIASSFISPQILSDQPNAKTTTEITAPWGTAMASFTNTNDKWYNLYKPGTYTFKISANVLPSSISGANTINVNATLQYDLSNGVQNVTKLVGGLRINKITSNDGITVNTVNEKSFIYEQPLEINPVDIYNDYLTRQYSRDAVSTPEIADTVVTRNTSSKFSPGSLQGGTVAYAKVTTLYGANGVNGKTVSLFTNDPDDINELLASKIFPYPPADSKDHRRGLLLEETYYKSDLVTPLKKAVNTYGFTVTGYTKGIKAGYKMNYLTGATNCLYTIQNSCGILGAYVTNTSEQVKRLTSAETTYDNNGQNPLTTVTNYFYDNPNNLQPVRTEVTDSKNLVLKTYNRTPLEKTDINTATPLSLSASQAIDSMIARNIISPVLQQEQQRNNTLLIRSTTNYKLWGNNIIMPENIVIQKAINTGETRVQFNRYDSKGNLMEQQKTNDALRSYIYDYTQTYPIAEVMNSDSASVAYTSFESDGKGNWTFTGSATVDPASPTGKKVYNLPGGGITKSGLSASSTYIVSYWSKNGAQTVNAASATTGRTANGWTYYEHKVINPSGGNIAVSGTGTIDELRLYPQNALMTSYCYDPLIGLNTQCDANNRISYYEYDAYNRLALIRDLDKKIIKKVSYNYTGQTANDNFYQNVVKSGVFTRNNCTPGNSGSQVTYSVPANIYSSAVSQPDADQKAQDDVNANGQAYANANGTCTPASVTLISQNNTFISGFTAVYTNVSTGAQSSFGISSSTSPVTMGTLPVGTYNITISKTGNNTTYIFGVYNNSCTLTTITGKSATFSNIVLSASSSCNGLQIDTNN